MPSRQPGPEWAENQWLAVREEIKADARKLYDE
jgi:hypothetical protein